MFDWSELENKLLEKKQQHLYRHRLVLQTPQAAEIVIDGSTFLSFCSNDYLGLANHPKVIAAFKAAADRYGVGSGASHLVVGHSEEHHLLEQELAEFVNRPRALLFSTGYMANLGVISSLMGHQDIIFADKLNHASLNDACLLSRATFKRYPHGDTKKLSELLARNGADKKLIVSDGLFSMDGDLANISELAKMAHEHSAWLMIDDAHGFGVLGNNSQGSINHFNLTIDTVPIMVGTLGKALGTAGAFVAGDEALIDYLSQQAHTYIYTTAIPPAVAAATRASLKIIKSEKWRRDNLNHLITFFRQGASELGLPLMQSESAIQPLLVGSAENALAVSHYLKERGVLVAAIRPPTVPVGTARLRITLSAVHQQSHITQLLDLLSQALQSLGIVNER